MSIVEIFRKKHLGQLFLMWNGKRLRVGCRQYEWYESHQRGLSILSTDVLSFSLIWMNEITSEDGNILSENTSSCQTSSDKNWRPSRCLNRARFALRVKIQVSTALQTFLIPQSRNHARKEKVRKHRKWIHTQPLGFNGHSVGIQWYSSNIVFSRCRIRCRRIHRE